MSVNEDVILSLGTRKTSQTTQRNKKAAKCLGKTNILSSISCHFSKLDEFNSKAISEKAPIETPYKSCISNVTKHSEDNAKDENDFQTPKPFKKAINFTQNKAILQNQKKRLRKRQPTLTEMMNDNFPDTDTDPNHLQMALALSRSMSEIKNSEIESEEFSYLLPTENKTTHVKKMLEQFGFKIKRNDKARDCKEYPSSLVSRRKKSKYQYITPVLYMRTEEDRGALINSKLSLILSKSTDSCAPELNFPKTVIKSETLQIFHDADSTIFRLNHQAFEDLTSSVFYISTLDLPVSKYVCGSSLKHWRSIPGRDLSPEISQKVSIKNEQIPQNADYNEEIKESFRHSSFVEEIKNTSTHERLPKSLNDSRVKQTSPDEDFPNSLTDVRIKESFTNSSSNSSSKVETGRRSSLYGSLSTSLCDEEMGRASTDESQSNSMSEAGINQASGGDLTTYPFYKEIKQATTNEISSNSLSNEETERISTVESPIDRLSYIIMKESSPSETLSNSSIHVEIGKSLKHGPSNSMRSNTVICPPSPDLFDEDDNFGGPHTFPFRSSTSPSLLNVSPSNSKDLKRVHSISTDTFAKNSTFRRELFNKSKYVVKDKMKRNSSLQSGKINFEPSVELNATDYVQKVFNSSVGNDLSYMETNTNVQGTSADELNEDICVVNEYIHVEPVKRLISKELHNLMNCEDLGGLIPSEEELFSDLTQGLLETDSDCDVEDDELTHSVAKFKEKQLNVSEHISSEDTIIISDEELNYSNVYCTPGRMDMTYERKRPGCGLFNKTHSISDIKNENVLPNRTSQSSRTVNHSKTSSSNIKTSLNANLLNDSLNSILENDNLMDRIEREAVNFRRYPTSTPSENREENSIASTSKSDSCISTPKNRFVIKTDNVTPMMNYDSMTTPKLLEELDKFGLKPLKRKRSIKILKCIYETGHPLVKADALKGSFDDGTVVTSKRQKLEARKEASTFDVENAIAIVTNGIEIVGDLLLQNEKEGDLIFERKRPSKIPSCSVPLQIIWHNFITSNSTLRENILLYEPLQVEVLHLNLKELGYKFHLQDLIRFLDQKCITIRIANKQN